MATTFNPFTKKLDYVQVADVAAPSTTANPDLQVIADGSTNGIVYFWVNGHRFKLTGTVDDPLFSYVELESGSYELLESGSKLILEG